MALALLSRIGRFAARQPLRRRLLALVLLLTGLMLAVGGIATTRVFSYFLLSRMNQQITQASEQIVRSLTHSQSPSTGSPAELGTVGYLVDPNRTSARVLTGRETGAVLADPRTVDDLASISADGRTHDVSEVAGLLHDYRMRATRLADGSLVVVGQPLGAAGDTLHRLILIEFGVGLVGLAVVGLAGRALVGVALRPLARMTDATQRIAQADLTGPQPPGGLHVPDLPAGTEVGQLSVGMNHMLSAIGSAFADRDQAQDRLKRFVADASHELRTPLATIRGYAELFRRRATTGGSGPDEDVAVAMDRIEAESARMSVLVDDLLLLARLDQGRPLDQREVDLGRLAIDAASDFRVTDHERPIVLDLPPEPPQVLGDEMRLRQVLANLLGNVHAHTPPGTTVTLRLGEWADRATVEVVDDGPGIPADAVNRVFDRFYRADPSRTRASGGTGLGLAIVEAIVAAHGGGITLTSEPGATAVRIWLPRRRATPA